MRSKLTALFLSVLMTALSFTSTFTYDAYAASTKKTSQKSTKKTTKKATKPVSRGITEAEPIKDVDKLIGKALSLKGTRYVYGGSTPNGFDCSGFTSYCYKSIGIDLPHSSVAQAQKGQELAREALVEGAVVYFNTSGKGVSHVGIYLGNGEFIHASSGAGKVIISNLNEGYYKERYMGARLIK